MSKTGKNDWYNIGNDAAQKAFILLLDQLNKSVLNALSAGVTPFGIQEALRDITKQVEKIQKMENERHGD